MMKETSLKRLKEWARNIGIVGASAMQSDTLINEIQSRMILRSCLPYDVTRIAEYCKERGIVDLLDYILELEARNKDVSARNKDVCELEMRVKDLTDRLAAVKLLLKDI